MYKVLIVDDEPAAVQYIRRLIELKCKDFEVCGTAANGVQAVEWMEDYAADVVITDVMMPEMNGIELVSYVQEHLPNVVSIVVSVYQEFEFVQGAIRAGVCDYLLKPIDPEELRLLFGRIKQKLDRKYYTRRNRILHKLSNPGKKQIDWEELEAVFPSERYYAAVIRKNEMISRFNGHVEWELYSMENEQVIIYGRDSMEMLFLYAEEMVVREFLSMMNHEFCKQQEEGVYLTMVVREEPFAVRELPDVMSKLYSTLDQSIVVGEEQKIFLGKEESAGGFDKSEREFERLMYLVRRGDIEGVLGRMADVFRRWEQECCPEFRVKEKIRYLFYEMQNAHMMEEYDAYLFDDAFTNVASMSELCGNLCEFVRQNMPAESVGKKQDKEEIFRDITGYLNNHPSEQLSVQDVCRRFGISQATLNRMFRKFADMSYSGYLTDMRIRTSQELLKQNPDSYIKDIASAVGYSDQFYFSRIFRTVTGMSPTEFAEKAQQESE